MLDKDTLRYWAYRFFPDRLWRRTLILSARGRRMPMLPRFPKSELQAGFVGKSGGSTMVEAWKFYALMSDRRHQYGCELGKDSQVLDFGCGWGRFARMFIRDVPASGIWCVDTLELALQLCEDTGVPGHRVRVDALPPSDLSSATFDLAFAYSVFSHLSEKSHLAWSQELARVVKPGGLVFVTTQGPWFLDRCREMREHPELRTSRWNELMAEAFPDHDAAVAAYDAGEFVYAATGGGPKDPGVYGEAVVPVDYFERAWGAQFEVLESVVDQRRFAQVVVVLRRR